jgi:hypothetical protein
MQHGFRHWINLVEAIGAELPWLILITSDGRIEQERSTFAAYLQNHNLPNVGSLVQANGIWCNALLTDGQWHPMIYWKAPSPAQIAILVKTLLSHGMPPTTRCDVNVSAHTSIAQLPQMLQTMRDQARMAQRKSARKPSKQLLAADQMHAEILNDDVSDTTFSRVIWQNSNSVETNSLDVLGLADSSGQFPGVYGLHVGDVDFWFHKLIDDYGNEATAWEIEILPARGDVLVEDVQYAIPDDSGFKAESGILLTTRKILREGKDFKVVREMTDDRTNTNEAMSDAAWASMKP